LKFFVLLSVLTSKIGSKHC